MSGMTWLRILVVAAAFLAAAVALLPLRFVLHHAPVRHPELDTGFASGTVWSGRLEGVTLRGLQLGDFDVAVSPADLVLGRLAVRFSSEGIVREGRWKSSPGGGAFEGLKGLVPLDRLSAGAPPGAFVSFLDGAGWVDGSGCREASGRVLVDGLSEAGFTGMEGTVGCETGRIILALTPSNGPPFDLVLDPRGGQVGARSADAATLAALSALGFNVENSGPQ